MFLDYLKICNRKKGREMSSTDLLAWLDNFLEKTIFNNYIVRTWIFKNSVVVADCIYKGEKFAIDLKIDADGLIDIFLVNRDDVIFLLKKTYAKKVRLATKVEFNELAEVMRNNFSKIFEKLDGEYKYDVTIIIPVHNRENLIQKCIWSLNNQTFSKKRYEVVFVDDYSTDNSIETIKGLVDKDLNYSILERPIGSGNASTPRNEGVKYSKSKYVLFLDSDDYLAQECVEKSFDLAEKNASEVVFLKMGSDEDNPRGVPGRTYKHGTVDKANVIEHHLLRSNPVFRLYKRSFLLREGIMFDPTISVAEDKLYTVMVLSKATKISILADSPYVFITRHDGNHLSRKEIDLQIDLYLYLSAYNWIFISKHDFDLRNQLYNAWTVKVIERLIQIIRSKRIGSQEKYRYFSKILMYLNYGPYFIDRKYIYKEFQELINSLIERNYQEFEKLVLI